MKQLIAPIALAAALVLTGCSTPGSTNATSGAETTEVAATPTPEPVQIPDLTGAWKQNNTKSDDGWTSATITDDTITVNFVTDGGDTTSLFWVGTYTAPTDDTLPYVWTSTRDKAATDNALLASTDDTKDFTFADDEISFPVSIAGTSTTVRLSKD
ncbi:hypothetical protein [Curtobacterium sp. PhB115]|uniref:hypothetical protein n=1 Tax=Curtobacterium sp. PhB115 TaxID=2485173 RepID=UPI000FC1A1D0|nr:hypothetical protein [Curtobacterium sp. PhB115]ROP64113.1 hypothetical protein EDF19_3058 [Curtobacterium sp. PhB115]